MKTMRRIVTYLQDLMSSKLNNPKSSIWSHVRLLIKLRNSCVKKNALTYNKNWGQFFSKREFDVYFQGYYFHSFNSTLLGASSKQIHAWQGPYSVPLFEFHDKRHFMEFYPNLKVPYSKVMGTIKDQAFDEQPDSLHIYLSSKEVKNMHTWVRNTMEHSDRMWADSTGNWPGFVHLLGLEGEGMIDCSAPFI